MLFLGMLYGTLAAATVLGEQNAEPEKDYFDMSLQELMDIPVVSATLREEHQMDVPVPIYIVTAQDIRERGYYTLKDIMNDVPGFVDLSDTNENIVGVRGAYASTTNKILILIDGHRMNSFSLGRYNTDQYLGVDAIQRIEFIQGPGSVLYGTGALMGVVNIITNTGADAEGVFTRGTTGSFYNEGSGSWGAQSGDMQIFANFTYLDGEGDEIRQPAAWDIAPVGQTQAPGVVYWNRYDDNWSALISARYKDTDIHLRRGHYFRAAPRAANGSFYDYDIEDSEGFPVGYGQDDTLVDVTHVIRFEDGSKLTLNPGFHYIHLQEQSWISQYGANRLPPLGSRSGQNSEEVHWHLKSYYERQLTETVSSLVGIDAWYIDFQRADAIELRDGNDLTITPERMELGGWPLFGIFSEFTWKPVAQWAFTAGLRYDDFDDLADPQLTPRFAAVYRPSDRWSFKLIYGQSYLSPQWEHQNINSERFAFVSNPDLKPERMEAGDFIVQYQNPDRDVTAWVDLFVNEIEDIITPKTEAGKQIYVNFGSSQYWGVETGLQKDLCSTLRLTGSYSFVDDTGGTDPQFLQDGRIKNVPRHIFRYGLRYEPIEKLVLNLWAVTASSAQVSDPITGETSVDGWTRLDFAALYSVKQLEIRVKVINLLDEDYEVGGTIVRPLPRYGRGFEVSLGYRF